MAMIPIDTIVFWRWFPSELCKKQQKSFDILGPHMPYQAKTIQLNLTTIWKDLPNIFINVWFRKFAPLLILSSVYGRRHWCLLAWRCNSGEGWSGVGWGGALTSTTLSVPPARQFAIHNPRTAGNLWATGARLSFPRCRYSSAGHSVSRVRLQRLKGAGDRPQYSVALLLNTIL